jgi:hypothetical protein
MKTVGSVLAAAGILVGIWVGLRGIYKPSALVKIVDVHFSSVVADSFGDAKFPVIEVFVHNSGEHAALVTEADFNMLRQWSLVRQFGVAEYLRSSAQYDVVFFPAKDTPYVQTVPVSHMIKPDDSDRITFVLKPEPLKPFEDIYKFDLSLRYDSTKQTAKRTVAVFYSAFDAYRQNLKVIGENTKMIKEEMSGAAWTPMREPHGTRCPVSRVSGRWRSPVPRLDG